MLIPGIVLSVVGVGFFCWLLFTLAVYALPFFTGLTAALAAFHVGWGVIGALVIGVSPAAQPWRSDRSPSQQDVLLETWQANAAGRYNHPADNQNKPLTQWARW